MQQKKYNIKKIDFPQFPNPQANYPKIAAWH